MWSVVSKVKGKKKRAESSAHMAFAPLHYPPLHLGTRCVDSFVDRMRAIRQVSRTRIRARAYFASRMPCMAAWGFRMPRNLGLAWWGARRGERQTRPARIHTVMSMH